MKRLLLATALCQTLAACTPDVPPGPRRLSRAGLYDDIARKIVVSDAMEFEPRYVLWSDGAVKRRWVRLPAGAKIDSSDVDHWRFPVGTQLFKEFSRDGRRLETRLIERIADTGDRARDYWAGAFIWNDDESEAIFSEEGASDVRGTTHDVPSAKDCWRCHVGEPGVALGVSAIQLAEGAKLSIAGLEDKLSHPIDPASAVVPGDPVAKEALGYLHANCGHCHWRGGNAWGNVDLVLRLNAGEDVVSDTELYKSSVGVPLYRYDEPGIEQRIAPGDPATSGIVYRMSLRELNQQMPPLASEQEDDEGITTVSAWVSTLAPAR